MEGQTGIKPVCVKTNQLGQDSAGEARKDAIRGRDQNERRKHFSKRNGPTQTGRIDRTKVKRGKLVLREMRVETKSLCSRHHRCWMRGVCEVVAG